jgi:hypothetical protein
LTPPRSRFLLLFALLAALALVPGAEGAKKKNGSVVLNFSGATLTPAQTLQFTGQPVDAQGNPAPGPVTWKTGSNSVATVDAAGLVTAVGVGSTTLTGTSGKRKGEALIQVIAAHGPGQTYNAALTEAQVNHVLVHEDLLYWTEADGKRTRIRRMPVEGGGITDLAEEPGTDHRGVGVAYVHLQVQGDDLYFSRNISGVATHTSVRRMDLAGGPSTEVLPEDAADEPFRPSRWRFHGQHLVAALRRAGKVGLPDATRLAAFDTVTDTWSQLVTGDFNDGRVFVLGVNNDWVFIRGQDESKTRIARLTPTGGNNTYEELLEQDGTDDDLSEAGAADDTSIYLWSRRNAEHRLQAVPVAGGSPATLLTANFGSGLVLDGGELFWVRDVTGKTGNLLSLPIAGGTPTVLRTGVQSLPALGGAAVGGGMAFVVEKGNKKQQRIIALPL